MNELAIIREFLQIFMNIFLVFWVCSLERRLDGD